MRQYDRFEQTEQKHCNGRQLVPKPVHHICLRYNTNSGEETGVLGSSMNRASSQTPLWSHTASGPLDDSKGALPAVNHSGFKLQPFVLRT